MTEYYNNILCVEGGWLYGDGGIMTQSIYKHLVDRGQITVERRACPGHPALIAYDSIPERFKQVIINKYGDPHKTTKHNQFKDKIKNDPKAYDYYSKYILDDERHLPEENQQEYCMNASILNTINEVINNRKAMRKAMGGKTTGLWNNMSDVVNALDKDKYQHTLPENPRRLKEKYNNYLKKGYESLIHAGFCNKNTEKINDNAKIWMLARWASQVNKVANEQQLLEEYNVKAVDEGWKPVMNIGTIHNFLYREDIQNLWWGHRYGELKAKEKFELQLSTILPTMRDSLWYSDGTKLNYFYTDENGKIATCNVYEVMDAYSECLIGYHISKSEDYEAQFNAYKMAIQFAGCKPYQITYDNQGGHKKLVNSEFLGKIAHLSIKTKPYNGKSKTIESAFNRLQSQILKKDWFFTGQNITTKKDESKANLEFVSANKANLPTLEEIKKVYKQRRDEWNHAAHFRTGKPRIEMYRESINPESVKVNMLEMVDLFWMLREKPVTCNAYGISFREKNIKYTYLVYNENHEPDIKWLREHIDAKFYVRFDPEDTSMIYLYDKGPKGLTFVCKAETKIEIHRNIQEQEDWESSFIKKINQGTDADRVSARDKMNKILEDQGLLPEQNGLISPRIAGVEMKKKAKNSEIGKIEKKISNKVLVDESNEDFDAAKELYNNLL